MHKKDIKNFTLPELMEEMLKLSESPYRAVQVFHWLYKKGAADFDVMTDLSRLLQKKLKGRFSISTIDLIRHLISKDGTEKFVFRLLDGYYIETVLIRDGNRKTICLSSQVGCKYRCLFCASGFQGFKRDLSTSEILNQILFLKYKLGHILTNYVFMGMGEPFDNYENVLKAIKIINDKDGMAIGARRITISTSGVIPAIERFKCFSIPINLSISLHAAEDRLRSMLMKINRIYPLEKLIKACEGLVRDTGKKLTLEYILIKGVNESSKDADRLIAVARRLKAKVNLIPCSPVSGATFSPPDRKSILVFEKRLRDSGVNTTIRNSRGTDILAGCGQLAGIG